MPHKIIKDYVRRQIPDIPNDDLMKIVNRHINNGYSLDGLIHMYKREIQVKEWNKRKDKHYYRVRMLNGGYKIVYMCPEMVDDFHKYHGYTLIG